MTETSRFWTGTTPGDAGAYSADAFNHVWELLFHAARTTCGPIIDSSVGLPFSLRVQQTTVASTNIEVLAGAALVDGTFYESDATITLAVPANALADPRIDTVVLRKDWVTQTIRCVLKSGTPAVTPVPPTLTITAGVLWEIPLADVAVASGFVTITNTNIRSRAVWANMSPGSVIHNVINNSGGTLEDGDIVIWDSSLSNAVTTTTQAGDKRVAGTWIGRVVNGNSGTVLTRGIGRVNMSGVTVALGDRIESGSTAKIGRVATGNGNLGRVMAIPGDGRPICYVDVQHPTEDFVYIRDEKTTGTDGGTFTLGAWRTRDLNTEVVDTGNMAAVAGNQITLQPGIYRVEWRAPAHQVALHKSRLQDLTGGGAGVLLLPGSTARNGTGGATMTDSVGRGRLTLTVATIIELQHQSSATQATTGFGTNAGFSQVEIYSEIWFYKEG